MTRIALEVVVIVIFLTIVIYRLGSSIDTIYNEAFSPKTDGWMKLIGKQMREARLRAAEFLETGNKDWTWNKRRPQKVEGIYKKAEALYGGTCEWKKKIKWRLEVSKACRSFIIPCLLVFVYNYWSESWPKLTSPNNLFKAFTFLATPGAMWVSLGLAVILSALYLTLRLHHIKILYDLVVSPKSKFERAMLQDKRLCDDMDEEIFCKGCLFLITPLEIRLIFRKGCDVEKAFPVLLSKSLNWERKSDTPVPS